MIGSLASHNGRRETWREYVSRFAAERFGHVGLACVVRFDQLVRDGEDEARAAWRALYEWRT